MADFTWTAPKAYEDTNTVDKRIMNAYQSENMRYLYRRPRHTIQLRDIGTYTTTDTSFVAVSETALRLRVTTQAATELLIEASLPTLNSGGLVYYDVLMDGANFLSSLDPTALTDGLAFVAASNSRNALISTLVTVDAIGSHYFDLYYRVSAGTANLYTDPMLEFRVREV